MDLTKPGLDQEILTSGMTLWSIVGGLIFSGIGFLALKHGRKHGRFNFMLIGAALMVYPYFVPGTAMIFLVGSVLSAALYFSRE